MPYPKITVRKTTKNPRFTETVHILRDFDENTQPTEITILANVQPADATAMNVLEKYNYKSGGIRIWTDNYFLRLETQDNVADTIQWKDKFYRVLEEYDWSAYADNTGHCKYIAGLINQPFTYEDQPDEESELPQYKDPFAWGGKR